MNSPANEDLVWFALEQLKKEKLIDNADQLPSNFAGMSRREVVKKVGLGTMIALPIVASMVAPVATHAQSLVGPGGTFTTAKTLSNCGGPYILGLCQTAAMTICASGATSGATNCSNPDNFVTCTCA